MSIITITSALQGAMFTLNAEEKSKAREIPVGKGVKAAVVLAGHLSAQDVRQQDGSYAPGAFGRLPIECAVHVSPTGTLEPVDDRHNGATA